MAEPFILSTKSRAKDVLFFMRSLEIDTEECIFWPFGITKKGRARFYRYLNGSQYVCPLACTVKHGIRPTDAHLAAHSCHNGHLGCINWKHLRWATRKENAEDAIASGAQVRGARVGTSKLNDDAVRFIRNSSLSAKELAAKFNVTAININIVRRGETWKHVA